LQATENGLLIYIQGSIKKGSKVDKKKVPSLAREGTSEETRISHCPEKRQAGLWVAGHRKRVSERKTTIYTEIKWKRFKTEKKIAPSRMN
jgi:hypothetical protein